MALENDLGDQLDRSCGKEGFLYSAKDERNILDTTDVRKADWIGRNMRVNCRPKHVLKER